HVQEHGIPHFHAEYQGQLATFSFDRKVLAGAFRSRTAIRLIGEWALEQRADLETNWQRLMAGEPLARIEPLE
ncbi:MAG TPA: DUF4160 domain-containing protein, partial [Polyangia bacterium]|nr:DUF4160 domain-containing protein [Polyangia bacterium]